MKILPVLRLPAIAATSLLLVCTMAPLNAQSQGSDAKSILKTMSDYISSQESIALTFNSDIEVITPQLEKIQFVIL